MPQAMIFLFDQIVYYINKHIHNTRLASKGDNLAQGPMHCRKLIYRATSNWNILLINIHLIKNKSCSKRNMQRRLLARTVDDRLNSRVFKY